MLNIRTHSTCSLGYQSQIHASIPRHHFTRTTLRVQAEYHDINSTTAVAFFGHWTNFRGLGYRYIFTERLYT